MKPLQALLSLVVLLGCSASERTEAPARRSVFSLVRPAAAVEAQTKPGAAPASPRRRTMPMYLTRFSYTPETWARLAKQPEDRRNAARAYIESVGGKLHGFWYAFGEYEGYTLWEAPDNVSMAAVSFALSGGGAMSKSETTPLLTVEETLEALGRVEGIRYRQPGK
jgi:uncharacterized protein with GYD domain